jgi:Ras-related protein Rab-1A
MSYRDDYDVAFKVLLVGDSAVGKSSIFVRYVDNAFNNSYISTIGVDFKIRSIKHKDKSIRLQIWDTAGQERFKSIASAYYKGAHGILLVYDITDSSSFENLHNWINDVRKYNKEDVPIILIGNKIDLKDRAVSELDAEMFASAHGLEYMETSAKDSINVDDTFMLLTKLIIGKHPLGYIYDVGAFKTIDLTSGEQIDGTQQHTRRCLYC